MISSILSTTHQGNITIIISIPPMRTLRHSEVSSPGCELGLFSPLAWHLPTRWHCPSLPPIQCQRLKSPSWGLEAWPEVGPCPKGSSHLLYLQWDPPRLCHPQQLPRHTISASLGLLHQKHEPTLSWPGQRSDCDGDSGGSQSFRDRDGDIEKHKQKERG